MTPEELRDQFTRAQAGWQQKRSLAIDPPIDPTGIGPHPPDMEDRLRILETAMARVEAAIDGLRHSQNLTVAIVSLLALVLVGFGVYELQRLDQLSDRVAALPGQIGADLRDISKTLAESITAARAGQPQVILVPAPSVAPSNPPAESTPKEPSSR
jgi:hypothetical protein